MNWRIRDYRFTDAQVRDLGFSSYEELEKYYDLLINRMGAQPWTKEHCFNELEGYGDLERLDYTRFDRLKATLSDMMGSIDQWEATNLPPSVEDMISVRDALNRILTVYFNFIEREVRLIETKSQTTDDPKLGGR